MSLSLDWCSHPALTTCYLGYCRQTLRQPVHPGLAHRLADQESSIASLAEPEEWLEEISRILKTYTRSPSGYTGAPNDFQAEATSAARLADLSPALLAATEPLHDAMDRAIPDWAQQMTARIRPLRELWRARGPGFERQLARQFEMLSPSADLTTLPMGPVAAVFPITGGYGLVLPDTQGIMIEAALTDFDDHAPEIIRLAWLITLQRIKQAVRADSRHALASLASDKHPLAALLMTLAFASDLEWLPVTLHTLERTLTNWLGLDAHEAKREAARLATWWNPSEMRAIVAQVVERLHSP